MLDYKDILTKRYVLRLSLREIAEQTGARKSGVHDFLKAFEKCGELDFPLPPGITNAGIAMKVYSKVPGEGGRDESYEYPDYQQVLKLMNERKNMTLQVCWGRYVKRCKVEEKKPYQYRQFCELFGKWCEENYETAHFTAVIAQTMEVDFAGKTFDLINRLTGEIAPIVVFVAILPYSQYIYAKGMESTKEMQWIEVNNNALKAFGGVPAIVVCDNNCKGRDCEQGLDPARAEPGLCRMGGTQPHSDPSRQGPETPFLSAKKCYRQSQPEALIYALIPG